LRATNRALRPIKLSAACLVTTTNRQILVPHAEPGDPAFPLQADLTKPLSRGEVAGVWWNPKELAATMEQEGVGGYLYGYFDDALGNMYCAPYPGVKVRRKGWLWRQREYVAPSV